MKLLSYNELLPVKGIRFSRSYIDRLITAGKFPKKIRLGRRTIGWTDESLEAYLAERARESL